jgi:hypothetical protein
MNEKMVKMENNTLINNKVLEWIDRIIEDWGLEIESYEDAMNQICEIVLEEHKNNTPTHEELIIQVDLLSTYLQAAWKVSEVPEFSTMIADLNSNRIFNEDLIYDVLIYLVEHNEVFLDIDAKYKIRCYDPESEEVYVRKIALLFHDFLLPIWKHDKYPYYAEVIRQFRRIKNDLSEDLLKNVIAFLKQFNLIAVISDNTNTKRIIKPFFTDNIIENISLWTFGEEEEDKNLS